MIGEDGVVNSAAMVVMRCDIFTMFGNGLRMLFWRFCAYFFVMGNFLRLC